MSLVLRTERLEISPLAEYDLEAFVAYRRDPDVARYQSWSPDYTLTDARSLLAAQPSTRLPEPGGWVQLALRPVGLSHGMTLIGDVAIGTDPVQPDTYELGVTTLTPDHRGQGFAREALAAVLEALFAAHGAHRIVMRGDARNASVLRLLRHLGLRHEGTVLEGDWFKGEWTTLERFAVLRREWQERR